MEAVGIEAPFAPLQALRDESCLLGRAPGAPGSIPTLWQANPGVGKLVEAVGIEPTSEERVLKTSTCVVFVCDSRQTRYEQRQPACQASLALNPESPQGNSIPLIRICGVLDKRDESALRPGRDCLSSQSQVIVGRYKSSVTQRRVGTQSKDRYVPRRIQERPHICKERLRYS